MVIVWVIVAAALKKRKNVCILKKRKFVVEEDPNSVGEEDKPTIQSGIHERSRAFADTKRE